MSRDKQRLLDYLDHIVQAIARIHGYVQDMDEPAFLVSTLVQDAVIRNFEIIGEANVTILNFLLRIRRFLSDLPMKCAMRWHTATSMLIWKLSGKPFSAIYRSYPIW